MTIPCVIYETKDFYLADAINEKIEAIKAAGLVQHWHMKRFDKRSVTSIKSNRPEVIKFHQLAGCFQVWTFGSFFGFLIFISEVLLTLKRNFRNKM